MCERETGPSREHETVHFCAAYVLAVLAAVYKKAAALMTNAFLLVPEITENQVLIKNEWAG